MTNGKDIEILGREFNLDLDDEIIKNYELWKKCFLEYNSHTNLMSKNDVQFLFEKHVFDSLAIMKWDKWGDFVALNNPKILDVGTGGGFPSVILSIFNPKITIIANDSRIKKINFIKLIKEKLDLKNLQIIYSRIENTEKLDVDLIISRAVGKIIDVYELIKKHKNKNTSFLIYKSKLKDEEMAQFQKKYKTAKFNLTHYNLPINEEYERVLVEVEI